MVDILAIGDAIVDIQTRVDESFIKEHGIHKGTMTLVEKEVQQQIIAALDEQKIEKFSGGSAANTIISITQLGGTARFFGKVGNDPYGAFYREDMKKAGVIFDTPSGEGMTGRCLVLVTPDGERTMLTHLGICGQLSPDDIALEHIKEAKMVYIEGYLWDSPPARETCMVILKEAKKLGKKVAFTVSDPFVVCRYKDEFLKVIPLWFDLLFCNLDEGRELTGRIDQEEVIRCIGELVPQVAMTLGDEGALVFDRGTLHAVPTEKLTPIDTNGAGDAFAGGFLYRYLRDHSIESCAHMGNCYSGLVVSQMGARNRKPIPDVLRD
ncbi:MAG: adenosine kinase [bacterium]